MFDNRHQEENKFQLSSVWSSINVDQVQQRRIITRG